MIETSVSAGTQLGPYRIVAPLGAGGMGQVFKATDTRLNRTVALKVLSVQGEWPAARERFKREAEAIAGLNHPHICTLYDVGEYAGTDFLVMEFLEGETLASRLAKGRLPLDKALRYGLEIVDALDKAHRQGIVHRDLKPGNIMITRAGAKLLDFGLAKLGLSAAERAVAELSAAPTHSTPLTSEGTLLGTLQYMAPEQLEGRDADVRSDIFAFGTTLYEMVTGRKAFEAGSQASLIGAILHTEPPPVLQLQALAPPALDWMIRGCLAKDPYERWQNAHDLKLQLLRIREGPEVGSATPTSGQRWIPLTLGGIALIALVALAAVLMFRNAPLPDSGPVARFGLAVDAGQLLALDVQRAVAMSPDGSRLAYVAARRGKTQLYVRPLPQVQARAVPGTENASDPFFSPDGRWLGFSANGQLRKIPIAGGAPITLAAAPVTFGASWGADDTVIYAPTSVSGLFRVPAGGGGKADQVTTLDTANGELAHRWPHVLPGGKAVLFTVWRGGIFDDAQIAVYRLDTKTRTTVLDGGMDAQYIPTGHLLYARSGTIMAAPFNLAELRVTGAPVPILEGVETNVVTGAAHFSVSEKGSLAFVPGTTAKFRLVEVDRQGKARELPVPQRTYNQPRLSPDGRRLTFALRGVDTDIWSTEVDRGGLSRLTLEAGENETPVWSFDGTRVAYSASRAGKPRTIFVKPSDQSGAEQILHTSQLASHLTSWSRDGVLAFTEFKGLDGDIWVLPPGGKAHPFLETPFNEHGAMFSPDGKWLAYTSDESGQDEVYLQPFPGPGAKTQISTDGGSEPAWARSGAELFYRNADKLMSVTIRQTPHFEPGAPRPLFDGIFEGDHRGDTNYDVTADGQRFIMIKSDRQFTRLNVVLNWFRELREATSR